MNSVKICLAQHSPVFLNKEESIKKACSLIKEASDNAAELILFPEAFIPAYPDWVWLLKNSQGAELNALYVKLLDNSISVPDESTKILCNAAKEASIYVAIGINERNSESSNTSIFNSLLIINNEGKIESTHRKLIPTGGERTVWSQAPEISDKIIETPFGKIGGLICWENYMPLARVRLYELGIQLFLSPTWDKSDNWIQSMQHIAREGGVFVLSCCTAIRMDDVPDSLEYKKEYPKNREWINAGNSCVIDPKGKIIAAPYSKNKNYCLQI
jgi:nitrilase